MQKKIIIAIILNVIIVSASLGIIGYLTVQESIDRSLQNRLTLAGIIAKNIDLLLERNLNRLFDISLSGKVDLKDGNWEPEKKALQTAYQYSIFTDGIFLLNTDGTLVLSYPHRLAGPVNLSNIPYVSRIIVDGKPLISDIYTQELTNKKIIYAMVPLKDKAGEIVGVVGGEIDPTNFRFNEIIKSVPSDPNTYLEIVDSNGIIVSSNSPKRTFTGSEHNRFIETVINERRSTITRCHRCHTEENQDSRGNARRSTDILAFAPLEMARWGVSIMQPEQEVFAPAQKLKKTFLIFSISSIGIALIIAIGMSRSIVKPVHELIEATHKIAEGDMSKTIGFGGIDEIGLLSSSFEVMRVKLADSLEGLHQYNVELENRVAERTKEIQESQQKVETLLQKVISAQEDERKRIARGLHDEILQDLSVFLISLDMCRLFPENMRSEKIDEMRKLAVKNIDDIHNIIRNLRPSVLDDLGLESAVKWLLDTHLAGKGTNFSLKIDGARSHVRFDPVIEITLFRIIQEAIINIARYAKAGNVQVMLQSNDTSIRVDIEDDGEGFDLDTISVLSPDKGRGLGILGMRERATLLNGNIDIKSSPGKGTSVHVTIPLKYVKGDEHV